jgi:hypothetical protein
MSFSNNTTGATSRQGTASSVIAKRHEQLAVPDLLVAPIVLLLNDMNS